MYSVLNFLLRFFNLEFFFCKRLVKFLENVLNSLVFNYLERDKSILYSKENKKKKISFRLSYLFDVTKRKFRIIFMKS